MFTKENIVSLPGKHVKFDVLEESKIEILVNNSKLFDDVCQDIIDVLESILEASPSLLVYDKLFILYSFGTSNRAYALELHLNK